MSVQYNNEIEGLIAEYRAYCASNGLRDDLPADELIQELYSDDPTQDTLNAKHRVWLREFYARWPT